MYIRVKHKYLIHIKGQSNYVRSNKLQKDQNVVSTNTEQYFYSAAQSKYRQHKNL